jgi:hypothetical protein
MRASLRIAAFSLGISLSLIGGSRLLAQTPAQPPPSPLLVLSVIDVKPEMLAEFGELQAQAMTAQRKGGQPWRETWNVLQFGNPHRVGVLRPLSSFAELDGQSYTIKGVGAEQARVINERSRRMIVAQQIYALRARPDLGFGNRPTQPNLAVLTTITVSPGRNGEFELLLKNEVVPAYKKAGHTFLGVSQIALGGDPNQYLASTLYPDFAALQQGSPILRALGPEGFAKFNAKLAGIVAKMEYEVVRFNPALSFRHREG